ncbi:MAG: hypothetical protein R3E95_11065 [Thiolinea sp.]
MIVTARSARRSASLFSWGQYYWVVLLPFLLLAFWFGASIFIYTPESVITPNPRF